MICVFVCCENNFLVEIKNIRSEFIIRMIQGELVLTICFGRLKHFKRKHIFNFKMSAAEENNLSENFQTPTLKKYDFTISQIYAFV